MEIKKVNLDRKPIASEYIQSKQDFQHVVNAFSKTKVPVWKQPLFYGAVGVASLAAVVTSTVIYFNNNESNGQTITLISQKEIKDETTANVKFALAQSVSLKDENAFFEKQSKNKLSKERIATNLSKKEISPISKTSHASEKMIEEESFSSLLPSISGVYHGDISYDKLCSSNGIEVKNGVEVRSFKIQYAKGNSDKEVVIRDKKLSELVCNDLEKSGINQMVFITEIEAFDGVNKITIPSMNFWVKFDS